MSLYLLALLAAVIAFLIFRVIRGRKTVPKDLKELPGPKGYPWIGSILEMPREKAYIKFKEWADRYGPIFKLQVLGVTHVVISSQKIAEDLLAKRGAIYSDRGQLHMVKLVTGGGDLLAASSETDYWRRGRRFAASMLTPPMAAQWEPFQERESRTMVQAIMTDPERYRFWFDQYATAVSLREIYGVNLKSEDDGVYHTNMISERMHNIERVATPGGYMVELIPALMYLPEFLAPFRQEARGLHRLESTYFAQLVEEAQREYEQKMAESPPSFARSWLERDDHWELSTADITYVLGTLYGGGSGTTSNAMQSFLLTMCHYPEWQARLQQEVDGAVGENRLPSFSDRAQLPLVRAIAKEILRWRPVVPGNIPHKLIEDDVYEGYHIPKGALVYGNQWAIHRQEDLYPDADVFNPDRYLNPKYPTYKEPLEQNPNIKRFSAFGFGRRICPGLETADRSLFIQIATLAWACHISKKMDSSGKEIPVPWYDYTEGSNVMPKRFDFELKPRSQKRAEMIRERPC